MVEITELSARPTEIEGLVLLTMKQVAEDRGTVREFYRESAMGAAGLPSLGPWRQINVTHTWDSDLNVFLIAPNGARIELTTGNGGGGDNYTNTVFDDEAATLISAGAAPFTGSFRPAL